MYESMTYEESLNDKNSKIYIDVRSPGEYALETIPGAINLPVLLDDERVKVGTLYVNGKINEAKTVGIEGISSRLPDMFKKVLELKKQYKNLYFFCSRGGYRSSSIVNLLCGVDVRCFKITNGYKGYRKFITENMEDAIANVKFITLYGYTGTGKTSILNHLRDMGYNVLDLEGFANHRGSLLGSVGLDAPRTQKMFDSLLFDSLRKYRGQYVFTEGESKKIGRVYLPNSLYDNMRAGIRLLIDADIDFRVNEITSQYIHGVDKESMIDGLQKLARYISKEKINRYIGEIADDNYYNVVRDLCENYYDKNYKLPKEDFENTYINVDNFETAKLIAKDYMEVIG